MRASISSCVCRFGSAVDYYRPRLLVTVAVPLKSQGESSPEINNSKQEREALGSRKANQSDNSQGQRNEDDKMRALG